jgi:GntR family transcriptional regulator
MLIRIDENNAMPLFEQIAAQIRGALARGDAPAGQRLLPARELAATLGVNLHTVLRAYQQLADDGLVEMRRGRGVTVLGTPAAAGLADATKAYIAAARRLGLADSDIVQLVKGHL